MVDPLIPLAFSMSIGRGFYAFFLGAGVSSGANVLTGRNILRRLLGQIHKIEKEEEKTSKDFDEWLASSCYSDLTYSQILEMLYPSSAGEERRNFHETLFRGKEPSRAHRGLARLVEAGFVTTIVTTNFDSLMEKALDEVSVQYVVVTDDRTLQSRPPRDHSECFLLKLHGDWRGSNLKITQTETSELEPGVEGEFELILNRYGIVVLGYAGADRGVMDCLRKRCSPYMLYWLTKGNLNKDIRSLLVRDDALEVSRPSADEFMEELERKIHVLTRRKMSESPLLIALEVESLTGKNDMVTSERVTRQYTRQIAAKIADLLQESREYRTKEDIQRALEEAESLLEGIVAIGLALIRQGNQQVLFRKLKDRLISILDAPRTARYQALQDIPWCLLHYAVKVWGASCLRERNVDVLGLLLKTSLPPPHGFEPVSFREVVERMYYNSTWRFLLGDREAMYAASKRLSENFEKTELVEEFFDSTQNWHLSLEQFQALLALWLSRGHERSTVPPIPVSNNYTRNILAFFHTLLNDRDYCNDLAYLFGESYQEFMDALVPRMENVAAGIDPLRGAYWSRVVAQMRLQLGDIPDASSG